MARGAKAEQLATRVDQAAKTFKQLTGRVDQLEGRIAGIEKSLEPLKKTQEAVEATLARFRKTVDPIPDKLKELEAEIVNITQLRTGVAQSHSVSEQVIKGIEIELDTMRQRLGDLESLLNILNQQVSEVTRVVEEVSEALAGKPTPRVPSYVIEALKKLKR